RSERLCMLSPHRMLLLCLKQRYSQKIIPCRGQNRLKMSTILSSDLKGDSRSHGTTRTAGQHGSLRSISRLNTPSYPKLQEAVARQACTVYVYLYLILL